MEITTHTLHQGSNTINKTEQKSRFRIYSVDKLAGNCHMFGSIIPYASVRMLIALLKC